MATSSAVEHGLRRLFRRCVQCPPEAPQCPITCPEGQICSLVPPSCDQCARMTCTPNPTPPPQPTQGPNVGAIAGGVAGGVSSVFAIVFFVWLFWIKKRRAQQDRELQEEWEHDEIAHQKRTMSFSAMQHDAVSTRTRGSLANSILSRASNFIQIAYIPGVTNRNGSGRNSIHTPVPPVPAAYRQGPNQQKSPLSNDGDALFFGIDDLRGSTYSGASSARNTRYSSNRDTRYTVNSITPSLARDSVASDVYWDSATTAPMPASSLTKIAPRMVSVKSSPNLSTTQSPTFTSIPTSPSAKDVPVFVPGQGPSPNSSVRGKATQVTVSNNKKGKGRFPVRQANDSSPTLTSKPSTKQYAPINPSPLAERTSSDSDTSSTHARARDSLIHNIDFSTPPDHDPTESPFFDATELPHAAAISAASSTRPNPYASMASTVGVGSEARPGTRRGGSRGHIGGLSAVIEEAVKRGSGETGGSGKKEKEAENIENPFSDVNLLDS